MLKLRVRVQPPTNEGPKRKRYYGKLEASGQLVCFVKGKGLVPYNMAIDPAQIVKQSGKWLHFAVTIALHCEKRDGDPYTIERTMLVEDKQQPDWENVTLPSLQTWDIDSLEEFLELNPYWAGIELVRVGKWIGRDGIERTRTAIRVVDLYFREADMIEGRERAFGGGGAAIEAAEAQGGSICSMPLHG